MSQLSNNDMALGSRYALCIGIGTYTNLINHNLRYAVADAATIAERLADPQRGNFAVTLLTKPNQTSKAVIDDAMEKLLCVSNYQAEDLTVIYFSCHGGISTSDNTFCLLPSDATLKTEGMLEQMTVISIYDFARWFSKAKTQNVVVLLDVCHSGGAGVALQHFKLDLSAGPNFFIIGAARQDQVTRQSSMLEHGLFTHCLLRAFEQPPTKDGWLTISQIHNFISDEMSWFAKDQPTQIQSWSVSVNPNLILLRNPCYPELSPLPPLWNVPLQRNPFFTGQEDLLSQLTSVLQSEQKTALTQSQAINGLGGIGKTQLALEYAYRHRQNYHAVLWGRADTHEALITTFLNIAHLLDLPQKDEKDPMVMVKAVKDWLTDRSGWLFILDNADELALVKEFLPSAFRGHLLLTTRTQITGALAHKFEMKLMPLEIGALLLLRRAGRIALDASLEQALPADVATAKELSEEMGGLPLALDQAGAYIEEAQCSLQDYQRLYQIRSAELLQERGGVVPDHPEAVAATWSLAFQKVEQGNPAASDLLRLCAFLHPDAIPETIITLGSEYLGPQLQATASDPLALNKAITALRAYSLLHRDGITHTLTIHRLVQAVLKDSMTQQMYQHWVQQTVLAVNVAFPLAKIETWLLCESLLPHALACVKLIEEQELYFPEAAHLISQVGYYLVDRARLKEAEPLLGRALEIYEKIPGPKSPDLAQAFNNLAYLYRVQGNYAQAEPLYERALEIREKVLGPEHPDIAQSLNNLGLLYNDQSNYVQAEPLLKRALEIDEKVLGPEHRNTATDFNNLALLYDIQGQSAQAKRFYQRALEIREKVLGPEHPDTAQSLYNLAMFYNAQAKYAQAKPLLERALSIMEQVLPPEHPLPAAIRNEYYALTMKMKRKRKKYY